MDLLNTLDWTVIALYFVVVFGVAFWSGRARVAQGDSGEYFLAGRNLG